MCWLAFLAGIAVAARRLGDWVTVLGALGLVVAQPIYLYQITSSLPHAFAFPLLIWAVVALLRGSTIGLALITLLSGLLYPAVAPVLGLALAWSVFVSEGDLFKENAVRLKSLLLVGITGLVTVWLLAHSLSGTDQFGTAIEPTQHAEVFPENGPGGRHFYGVSNPIKYVLAKAVLQFKAAIGPTSFLILLLYCIYGVYGFFSLDKNGKNRKSLFTFILSGIIILMFVYFIKPYHLYRFILYPVFAVLPLLFVVGLQQSCIRLARFIRPPKTATIAVLALFALTFDSLDTRKLGYWWHLGREPQQLIAFAADQPPRTLFATWPGTETALELIPYVARRPLFVMRKAHYPAYEKYVLAMRERTHALVDAYLATDRAALRTLHCRWGVDYLIVNKAHFATDGARPRYFAPFDDRIEEIWRSNPREDFLLRSPDAELVALETGNFLILNLKPLDDIGSGSGAPDCS